MQLCTILSFLTYPAKHKEQENTLHSLTGTEIPLDDGKLSNMLKGIFERSTSECDIPVMFLSTNGQQTNSVRTELLNLIKEPTIQVAKPLAQRLQDATTHTSGMGLLFFCVGSNGSKKQIVIARFPADEGVVAERGSESLSVQFVDQVFLKNSYTYKAAVYQGASESDFWSGYAIDKQINHGAKAVAAYWVSEFLQSSFTTTSAAGTKRLATALKNALLKADDVKAKYEIASAIPLASNVPAKLINIEDFCDHFHFSPETKELILQQVSPARLRAEKFQFNKTEFSKNLSYKAIELDNGAILSAQIEKFEECFTKTSLEHESKVTYSTTGEIVSEQYRKGP